VTSGDRLIRASTALVVVGIGAVAAYVSYRHAYDVAAAHGETGATARLLPLTIDGLVYVASMVLLDSARRGQRRPALAGWALAVGIGATLAANVLHGLSHGPVGAVIAAWPAVCLVLTVELLMGMIRRGRAVENPAPPATLDPLPLPAVPVNGNGPAHAPGAVLVDPDPHHVKAAKVFAAEVSAGRVPSIADIKTRLRVGQSKATTAQAYLRTLTAEN
jgi:hypothetical protein